LILEKFQNKYRNDTFRAQWWDYGWNGAYFITICTQNREQFFGQIENGKMILSKTGEIAATLWNDIPKHHQFVELGEFVIMPNHIHGILIINKPNMVGSGQSDPVGSGQSDPVGSGQSNPVGSGHALNLLCRVPAQNDFKISEKIQFHPLWDRINLPLPNTLTDWGFEMAGKDYFTNISFATMMNFNALPITSLQIPKIGMKKRR